MFAISSDFEETDMPEISEKLSTIGDPFTAILDVQMMTYVLIQRGNEQLNR